MAVQEKRTKQFDVRYLYILLVLSMIIPLMKPLGLPIGIVKETRDVFEAVDALQPDELLVLCPDYSSTNATELDPMMAGVFKHALQNDVKVLMFSLVLEGPSLTQPFLEKISDEIGKEYGVDWVNLGYKPGNEVTLKKMVDDLWEGSANIDYFNTSLDQIPMMKDLRSLGQASLIVDVSGKAPGISRYLTYVGLPAGVPVTGGTTSVSVPEEMPYVRSGQYKGLLMGLKGAAEYELLLDDPGMAVAGMDAQSLSHLLVIATIVFGNIVYFVGKKQSEYGI